MGGRPPRGPDAGGRALRSGGAGPGRSHPGQPADSPARTAGASGEIPTDRPTVVLCHSGSRSALATQQLQKKGLTQVANLRGGLRAWKAQGLPLEHPA
nr:rhodanese-like domain-containing protein [Synechococcus sp. CCY 0621]